MSTSTGFLPIGNLAPPVPGLPDQADLNPLLTRTHYFDGRQLTAADLTRDQLYLDQRLREVGQALGRGVVRGFGASLQGGRITLQPGIAINGNGRVLQLQTPLLLDLNDRANIAGLNDGQHLHLETGLYALVVTYAEESRGSAEVFPRDLDGRSLQHDVDVEGIQAALMSLPDPPPIASELVLRAALMAKLALGGLGPGAISERAVALVVLAPLPGESFGRLAAALEFQPVATSPNLLMPHLDLLALRLYPVRPVHRVDTDADAWQSLWAEIGDTDPVYVRRPTRAAETGISGIRIATGTPVVLPAPILDEPLPDQPPSSPADVDALVLDSDAVVLARVNLDRLVNLRPSVDGMGLELRAMLAYEIRDDANLMLACMDLLILVERRFEPVLWTTLFTAARAGVLLKLRDLAVERLGEATAGDTVETMIEALLRALGIDDGLLPRWEALGAGG